MATSVNGTSAIAPHILATIEDWLALEDRPIVEVAIPELARKGEPAKIVLMQAMSGSLKEEYGLKDIADEHVEPDMELFNERRREKTYGEVLKGSKVRMVSMSVVKPNGDLLFTEDQIRVLEARNAAALERLYAKAVQLNGFDRKGLPEYLIAWLDEDDVKPPAQPDLEARLGNSPGGHTSDS